MTREQVKSQVFLKKKCTYFLLIWAWLELKKKKDKTRLICRYCTCSVSHFLSQIQAWLVTSGLETLRKQQWKCLIGCIPKQKPSINLLWCWSFFTNSLLGTRYLQTQRYQSFVHAITKHAVRRGFSASFRITAPYMCWNLFL